MKPNENHIGEKKPSPFRGKVLKCFRRGMEEWKKENPGVFLNDSKLFDLSLYLSETHKAKAQILYDSLLINHRREKQNEKKFKAFEIFLANLFYKPNKPFRISLSPNNWTKTRYNPYPISCKTIKDLIDILNENKLITMKIGYNNIPNKPNRQTRIQATKELLDYFPEFKTGVLSKPIELVIKTDDKKNNIEYKDTAETRRIRGILTCVNDVNSKADIRYHKYKLNANLVAIFKERFTWYGRLHTKGYRHYQSLSGDERDEITINGDSIVELDYSGLHPYLLYAKEKKQYWDDPYSVIDERPIVRKFLKEILLCMLNAKDEISAKKAADYWLHENHKERKQLKEIGIINARPMMDKFIEAHQPIKHYFFKGKETGMRIMNTDSKIAIDVIDHFGKKGIPILAIHDSFIVQEQYEDELFRVMKSTYKKHTKGFRIKVK